MQNRHGRNSLAVTAAMALGVSGVLLAGPAAADEPVLNLSTEAAVQSAVADHLSDDKGQLADEVGRFGSDGKTLFLGVSKATDEVKAFDAEYSNVEVEVSPKFVQAEPQAKTDLVGGAGYLMRDANGERFVCSNGFAGWDADNGRPIVLTAGHCPGMDAAPAAIYDTERPSTAPAASSNPGFDPNGTGAPGKWRSYQFGSSISDNKIDDPDKAYDLGVIDVSAGFTVKPAMTDWTTAGTDDLSGSTTPVTKVGAETLGAPVKKAGRTTGLTEGTVSPEQEYQFQVISGRAVHGFEVRSGSSPFSQPGDSGGGVFQGDVAIGVISGGPGPQHPDHGKWSWVSDLDYSLEKSGVNFTLTPPNDGGDDKANADANKAANADADKSAGADANKAANADADKSAGADANKAANADADKSAGADANKAANADADKAANADANKSAGADKGAAANSDASSDADGGETPEAPVVENQVIRPKGGVVGTAAPNAEVQVAWSPAAGADEASTSTETQQGAEVQVAPEGTTTVKTDENGRFVLEGPEAVGVYDYSAKTIADGQSSDATAFTVTVEDETPTQPPAERAIAIDPTEIPASDFVKEDKGVTITVKGFDEGETVTLVVESGPKNVKGIELTETADAKGVARFQIYGTSASNPSVYLGKYDVSVTGANDTEDEDPLTGSFRVVADEDGNGGGGGGNLPRTGAELTGLAAGATLLLVGGAAVVLTMRRRSAKN